MPEKKRWMPRLRLCGLWRKKTRDDREYLAGALEGCQLQIFVNDNKEEGSLQPDFFLYVCQGVARHPFKKKKEKAGK
jgi:hypothetical protein